MENPLYPQEPGHPNFVPREYFNQNLLLNKKLKQEKEDLSMQLFSFRQEKMDLAHKLRERDKLLGEYGLAVDGRVGKKTKINRVRGDTSTVIEEQKRALEEVEEEIKQKHREYESLKVTKAKMEKRYKDKIKRQEKQLQDKNAQFEEENTQRIGVEIQLKGSHINLEKVVGEIISLKAQLRERERDNAPLQIQLPKCNKYEKLIDQCRYLDGMISRKDMVIQNLVQKHNQEETKKMFEESKAWSLKYLKSG
ncbi:uncharacterized protein LOC127092581 [Lathyrus oleraceus]|uniref:uncharacterized protein LOC127092581 n=1 Tax=Pisum sativum TaxID=3888 RepID=UPI0021D3A246|nr:uncharacterized protein LOC127092581 [Pisum sativum]